MTRAITSYTITCSRPANYGAVLQTYGLNTALRNMGIDARVLDYNPDYYWESSSAAAYPPYSEHRPNS